LRGVQAYGMDGTQIVMPKTVFLELKTYPNVTIEKEVWKLLDSLDYICYHILISNALKLLPAV
jgi:hypothetical protein